MKLYDPKTKTKLAWPLNTWGHIIWLLWMIVLPLAITVYAAATHQSVCWEGYNQNGTYTSCG